MKLSSVNKLIIAVMMSLTLIGCSSDGGSSATSTVTGTFIDDPVRGLGYACSSGSSDLTNVNGEFTCNIGDDVTFSIANITIGTIAAQSGIITPYTLFPNNTEAALNLARLLQTLNSGTVAGVIDVNTTMEAIVPSDTNFTSSSFETALNAIPEITLVSASDAQIAMNSAITTAGGTIPTDLNHIPVADAGSDQGVITGSLVTLDGSSSSDADLTALTYAWNITTKPVGSSATLSDNTVVDPTFIADDNGTYIIELIVNDGDFNSSVDTVTILAGTTPILANSTLSVAEDLTVGTAIGSVTISNTGDSSITAITLAGIGNENFAVAVDGTITLETALDYETTQEYNLTTIATNTAGNSSSVTLNISVTNIAETTATLSAFTGNIAENSTTGTTIGSITITNSGDTAITAITLSGTGEGNFTVSRDGNITVKAGATLDYELTQAYSLTVVATNTAGDSASVAVDIIVTNINDNFPIINGSPSSGVGRRQLYSFTPTASDPDGDSPLIFSIINKPSWADFNITTGNISGTPDNADVGTYNDINISVTAGGDTSSLPLYNLTVHDTNSAPLIVSSTNVSVEENQIDAYTIVVNDPENDPITYSVLGIDAGSFDVNPTTGVVTFKIAPNYENKDSYSITVKADDGRATSQMTVTIDITNVDEVPTLENSIGTIAENAIAEDAVGNVTISDAGDSAITMITLSGDGNENFTISSNGSILVNVGATLDYEITPIYNLTAYATNGGGDSNSVTVDISIIDIDDTPPTFTSSDTADAHENRTDAIKLVATDDNAPIAYSITAGDSASFSVNSTTGVVEFITAPNFETKPSYTFTANATDTYGNEATQSITITITDEEITHNSINYESVVSPYTGKVWLDRHLGASQVCTALDDTACYGDYYQWGRNTDGHEESNSTTSSILATDIDNVGANFITNGTSPYDWTSADSDGALRSANWSKTDGTSVCPVGYRAPITLEIEDETINSSMAVANNTDAFNNFLKLPSAGGRNSNVGSMFEQGSTGYILSTSIVTSSRSVYLSFRSDNASITEASTRAAAYSVRCIKIDTTPPTFTSLATADAHENRTDAIILTATDDSGTITYSISGSDSASFDLNSTTGVITFTTAPDFEIQQEYTFTATATDAYGNTDTQSITITIIDEEITHNSTGYESILSPFTGKIWLDRNLGASQICTALDDTACYGDYYQWGRNTDGHEESNSTTSSILATDIDNVGANFITNGTSPYDWTSADSDGALRSANWSKTDGTSVCPVGYRVPSETELTDETINASITVTNNTDAFNNFLKLASSGLRRNDASMDFEGSNGNYWSSSVNSSQSITFYFYSNGIGTNVSDRAYGRSIRCIKD